MRIISITLLFVPVTASVPAETHDYVIEQSGNLYWPMTQGDAAAAKAALLTYLAAPRSGSNNDPEHQWGESHRAEVAANIGDYDLQYRGVLMRGDQPDRHGTRKIAIHGLCGMIRAMIQRNTPDMDLSKSWLKVADGGSCIFDAIYDPQTTRITQFSVNGIA